MTRRSGFSLLETAVATLLLGLAAAGFLGAISDSLVAVQASRERSEAVARAKSTMNQILARRELRPGEEFSGTCRRESGWRATVAAEPGFRAGPAGSRLLSVRLEVWWRFRGERKEMVLRSYRRSSVP